MRSIKFRAWDKKRKEWYGESDPNILTFKGFAIFGECTLLCTPLCDDLQYLEITQFTGLLDKNGKEIYEGDLLRSKPETQFAENSYNCFEVFYHDNECIGGQNIGFCINRMHTQGSSAGGCGFKFTPESIARNNLIIIGNIYEHKHLLEAE